MCQGDRHQGWSSFSCRCLASTPYPHAWPGCRYFFSVSVCHCLASLTDGARPTFPDEGLLPFQVGARGSHAILVHVVMAEMPPCKASQGHPHLALEARDTVAAIKMLTSGIQSGAMAPWPVP
ncbi:hypothetical protein HaLaN_23431 [Haematococcus lacustris]|uniref:Uncharacterized protein n=1 Tax=Haematococcus lacustris TaxID=44745 RepID=A0A699ZS32_HAELA|nr:hypothetical protein HaLaN_23431 [Haematococcus lacustris]